MGKTAKEHRKRVKKHADWLKNQKRIAEKVVQDYIAAKNAAIEEQKPKQPSVWDTATKLNR